MKQNKYNDKIFFEKYSQLKRSIQGLKGAGEWHAFKRALPNFKEKRVLDLGCGYGWHSQYALENGAKSVIVVDLSEKMLDKAKQINNLDGIEYGTNKDAYSQINIGFKFAIGGITSYRKQISY